MKASDADGSSVSLKTELIAGSFFLFAGVFCARPSSLYVGLAGACFVVAAGFLSAFITGVSRRIVLDNDSFERRGPRRKSRYLRANAHPIAYLREPLENSAWLRDWLPVGLSLCLSGIGFLTIIYGFYSGSAGRSYVPHSWSAAVLLALTFPILVLERKLAVSNSEEGNSLSRLLRLLILNCVGFAIGDFLRWSSLPGFRILESGLMLLTALVAAEIFLRSASLFFIPFPPIEERSGYGESFIAGLIRFEAPSLGTLNTTIRPHYGIDLGRSWALQFIRRAAVPLVIAFCVCGWLLSGVTALSLNDRAVYEKFGKAQAVFGSGLHFHLPWPLGILRRVEYGVVHEIPIVFQSDGNLAASKENSFSKTSPAEGPPPEDADRLWDSSHPSEASYLVASNRNGKENFEIVNIDLRIIYRTGLDDKSAFDSVYSVDRPDDLIRAAAGRMLARYFAGYTVLDVLGQNREQLIKSFQKELQEKLDQLSSGIEVMSVVVEAIHPPPGAATAYQDVQAATIRSITEESVAAGEATRMLRDAEATANTLVAQAKASATETITKAQMAAVLFEGDASAHVKFGNAYLFERRLSSINRSVGQIGPFLIVDHRIQSSEMPTIDLRFGAPQF